MHRSRLRSSCIGVLSVSILVTMLTVLPASARTTLPHTTSHASLTTINVGATLPVDPANYALFYADAKNMWARYGIKVNLTYLAPAAAVAALYTGSLDMVFDGTGSLVEAVQTHAVEVVGTGELVWVEMVARPSEHLAPISTKAGFKELNGLTFAGSSPGSTVDDVEKYLEKSTGTKLNITYIGGNSQVTAVQDGEVDLGVVTTSTLPIAQADGLQEVGNLVKITGGTGLYSLVGANKAFAKSHVKQMREFDKAYHVALTDANKDPAYTEQLLATQCSLSLQQAKETYSLQKPYSFLKPISLTQIRFDLNVITPTTPAAATTKYSTVVNNKLLFS